MPILKTKNENFFKTWSPEMAYILGFFCADGSMYINSRGGHFIDFCITDQDLILKIREALESNHVVSKRQNKNTNRHNVYRLQIGSKEIYNDLLGLGLKSKKSKRLKLPKIPIEFLNHFTRGYFDGDGCVSFGVYSRKNRKSKPHLLSTRFISGSKQFLEDLSSNLKSHVDLRGGFITEKKQGGFELSFSINDSKKLYGFMYKDAPGCIFLERKYNKFRCAIVNMGT